LRIFDQNIIQVFFWRAPINSWGSDDYRVKFSWQPYQTRYQNPFHASQHEYVQVDLPGEPWHAGLMIRMLPKLLD